MARQYGIHSDSPSTVAAIIKERFLFCRRRNVVTRLEEAGSGTGSIAQDPANLTFITHAGVKPCRRSLHSARYRIHTEPPGYRPCPPPFSKPISRTCRWFTAARYATSTLPDRNIC